MSYEQNLISRVLDGEKKAFAELIDGYKRLVSHIVFRMVKSKEDREDICQEVFVRVFQGLADFKMDCKLSGWIGRIAYNTSVNHITKRRVELWDDIATEAVSIDDLNGNRLQPDDIAMQNDLAEMLKREIDRLPGKLRVIISLYHVDEMTYREIGEIVGLPDGTVKSYLFRARQALRRRLEKRYPLEELIL